jgi:hypothetical protein
MTKGNKGGSADGEAPGPFDATQQDVLRTGEMLYKAKLAKVAETLKRSATAVETSAYEIAGAVETGFVTRVMLAAAELDKLADKTAAMLAQMEADHDAS